MRGSLHAGMQEAVVDTVWDGGSDTPVALSSAVGVGQGRLPGNAALRVPGTLGSRNLQECGGRVRTRPFPLRRRSPGKRSRRFRMGVGAVAAPVGSARPVGSRRCIW